MPVNNVNEINMQDWVDKYNSYEVLLDELQDNIVASNAHEKIKQGLPLLIDQFREFAKIQFDFFRTGFVSTKSLLGISKEKPPKYVLQKTLEQIANDLTVLEQIADDWTSSTEGRPKELPLKQATVMADNAFTFAYKNGFLKESISSFIYLHKTPVVRVIPYAKVALIGIPYTSVNPVSNNGITLQSLLAIPHEVGHFVYWNGQHKGQSIRTYLIGQLKANNSSRYFHWLEEIFADVYSSYVGGTVTAQSIQDILLDNRPSLFDLDDGCHPPAIIRPHVYAYTYEDAKRGEIISGWEEKIDELKIPKVYKHARIIKENNRIQSLAFNEIPFGDGVPSDGREIIETIVRVVAEIFSNKNKDARWANGAFGQSAYDELEAKIADSDSVLHVGAFDKESEAEIQQNVLTQHPFITKRTELLIQMGEGKGIQEEEWDIVFEAAGWTSGGEEDGYRTIE